MAEPPGFTGLGAPSLPGFPVSPLPGQCINSQPWLRALTHRVAPLIRGLPGRRRARARATVLSPVEPPGLARRLPSLGVGAWRSAPLLPLRVQCRVRVCAAITACSGNSGRYLVLCLSRFPLPAPRVLRCVWWAVLSGCPLPSLPGTPFHAVCAFRELGPVALLVVPACSLHVCALALPRRPPPPPWVVWRVHLARSRHWALVGPFHVVRAPPRVLPRSFAPSGVLGGGWSGPGSPLPGLRLCAPHGAGPWRSCAGGRGGGGGGPCAAPSVCAAGGASRAGVALPRSVPLPSLDRQQSGCRWRRSGHGGRDPHTAPVRARPPSLGAVRAASSRVSAGSLVPRGSCGSRRLGRGGGPCSGPSLGRGEGGPSPLLRGAWGLAPLRLAGRWGGRGGGSRRGLPAPPLGGGPRFPTLAPLLSFAHSLPACAFGRGRGAALRGRG